MATKALKTFRKTTEVKILSGTYSARVCRELSALDKVLEQKDKTIELFDQVVAEFGRDSAQVRDFSKSIWKDLYALERYEDLTGVINTLTKKEVMLISEYLIELDFPSDRFKNDDRYRQWMENKIVKEGTYIIKTLQALGREAELGILRKWLLFFSNDERTDTALRKAFNDT